MIKIAIADDHQIIIDGLKLLLDDHETITVVAESCSAKGMLHALKQQPADVLITDITMPEMDGIDLSLRVKIEHPDIKILALSMNENGMIIARMMDEVKVDGYIPKSSGKNELLKAIQTIAAGGSYFAESVLQQYKQFQQVKKQNGQFHLTLREMEIIECIIQRMSNKAIAEKLFISERTVETHRKNIFRKTNTKGEASLVTFVKAHNLLS